MSNPTCRWPECDRLADKRGFCGRDYERARRNGLDFEAPWEHWRQPRACRWPDCEALGKKTRGLCPSHYARARSVEDFEQPWVHWSPVVCEECGVGFTPARRGQRSLCSRSCRLVVWKRENAERHTESRRLWHKVNRGTVAARASRWAAENPDARRETSRAHSARRRAAKLGATAESFTVAEIRSTSGDGCHLCGREIDYKLRHPSPWSSSIDHIIPLSKGGPHVLSNVAMAHLRCNIRKGAALPTVKVF